MGLTINIAGETAHAGTLNIRTELVGLDELEAVLRQLGATAPQALGVAFYREMQGVLTDSKTIVPRVPVGSPPEDKHPGTLRASAHVEPPVIRGNAVSVRGGFGGAAIPYALAQHERLDYRHPHAGEGAKYLETHVLRRAVTMESRLARDLVPWSEGRPVAFTASASPPAMAAHKGFLRAVTGARQAGWRTVGGDY